MECIDCGHALRPRGTKAADAPGTKKEQPGPRCWGCYDKAPKAGFCRATKCKDCNRALRPRDATVEDYPGTVFHWGQGRCQSCWRLERGITKSRKNTRPTHCGDCERRLRPKHTTIGDHPGTVLHAGKGVCSGCLVKRQNTKRPQLKSPPKLCNGCAKPMRPRGTTTDTHPDTVQHAGHGMCSACEDAARRRKRASERVEEVITDPGLLRLRAERNERRRRQEQAQRIRTEQEAVQRRFIARRKVAA